MGSGSNAAHFTTGGPQEERTKRLLHEQISVSKPSVFALHQADLKSSRSGVSTKTLRPTRCSQECELQILHFNEEKEFLSRYVQRLLNQLRQILAKNGELGQLKRLTEQDDQEFSGEDETTLTPWFTSKEYANPLFVAYDARICELVRNEF